MNERLKRIIFNKLYEDLSEVEIIHYRDSIWFIDRKEIYWYFEYENSGVLYWRYKYFTDFFTLFTLEPNECQSIMSEWVEEVLNCKVRSTRYHTLHPWLKVEEVLNRKVRSTGKILRRFSKDEVEEVLNCKVRTTTAEGFYANSAKVEEILNCEVNTIIKTNSNKFFMVAEILNHETSTTN